MRSQVALRRHSLNRSNALCICTHHKTGMPSTAQGCQSPPSGVTKGIQLVQRIPVLSANRQFSTSRSTSSVTVKASIDLNSQKCSADMTWIAVWDGQPAKIRCKWSQSQPSALWFNAQVAVNGTATRTLRISGTPHQLHKASLLFNTLRNNSIDDSRAVATNHAGSTHPSDMQMRIDHRLQNSSGRTGSTSSVVQQLACPAPPQPDLQLELGWNLQVAAPILSMCKSFSARGSISSSSGSADKSSLGSSPQPETSRKLLVGSCLPLRQLKAAYDCKAGSINLSVAGPSWNLSLSVPAETRGVLGLPVPCSGKSQGSNCWPKLVLTFSPDISTVAAT